MRLRAAQIERILYGSRLHSPSRRRIQPVFQKYYPVCRYKNHRKPAEWTHIPANDKTSINKVYADWYTPYAFDDFHESDRGKTVYIALTWQNARGNIGQWSEILSAVIP